MNRLPILDPLQRQLRLRWLGIVLAVGAPLWLGVWLWLASFAVKGTAFIALFLLLALIGVGVFMGHRASVDPALARRLDALDPRMEDSAMLLFLAPESLSPLQGLQRQRLQQRLQTQTLDIRPPWPTRAIGLSLLVGALLMIFALWPQATPFGTSSPSSRAVIATKSLRLQHAQITVTPPAYTGLSPQTEPGLGLRAPEGSLLHWQLQFDHLPDTAELVFHDGERLPLHAQGTRWEARQTLSQSRLFRLNTNPPLADSSLYRLDVLPDLPPTLEVTTPANTLSDHADDQSTWPIAFNLSDDYGIAEVWLQLTLAQGEGESVRFKEQEIPLTPASGSSTQADYQHDLDLAALGFSEGDELVLHILARDNRPERPNQIRSTAYRLRWPTAAATDDGALEVVVNDVLPAYFRSQRQIIIDSEALLEARDTLDESQWLARSDAIGVDQRLLRLRYGQFLGEETEIVGAHGNVHGDDEDADDHEHGHDDHGHDDHEDGNTGRFGDEANIMAEYGHTHDIPEAATLLDDATRELLRAALNAMWQAELHLRQGNPATALPHEHEALDYIKQVQQASRIYLARAGLELPPLDEERRLSGQRDALDDRLLSPLITDISDQPLLTLWTHPTDAASQSAAEQWLLQQNPLSADALDLLAALDRVRRNPDCEDCLAALRQHLWRQLPLPAGQVRPRPINVRASWQDVLRAAQEAQP